MAEQAKNGDRQRSGEFHGKIAVLVYGCTAGPVVRLGARVCHRVSREREPKSCSNQRYYGCAGGRIPCRSRVVGLGPSPGISAKSVFLVFGLLRPRAVVSGSTLTFGCSSGDILGFTVCSRGGGRYMICPRKSRTARPRRRRTASKTNSHLFAGGAGHGD